MNATRQRDEYVDTARGIACILLVAYHAIGDTAAVGLRIDASSSWRLFGDLLVYIRMPLFVFLSGYVYDWKPFAGDGKRFLVGKARRLLLPMLVVGTAFAIIQSLVPGSNARVHNWTTLHIIPVAHYWFLEALFIIFIVVMILESLGLLGTRKKFAFVFTIAVVIHLTFFAPPYLGMPGAVYLFPYFLFGLACSRFGIQGRPLLFPALLVFLGAFGYVIAGMLGLVSLVDRSSVVALLAAASACFLILRSGWRNRGLMFIGVSSYAIFLFHVFFTASSRMALNKLGIHNIDFLVVVVTVAGLLGPILVERIADRFKVTRVALLGKAWRGSNAD